MIDLIEKIAAEESKINQEHDRAWRTYLSIIRGEDESSELSPIMAALGIDRETLKDHLKTMADADKERKAAAKKGELKKEADRRIAELAEARKALKATEGVVHKAYVASEVARGQFANAHSAEGRAARIEAKYPFLFDDNAPLPKPQKQAEPVPQGPTWAKG